MKERVIALSDLLEYITELNVRRINFAQATFLLNKHKTLFFLLEPKRLYLGSSGLNNYNQSQKIPKNVCFEIIRE